MCVSYGVTKPWSRSLRWASTSSGGGYISMSSNPVSAFSLVTQRRSFLGSDGVGYSNVRLLKEHFVINITALSDLLVNWVEDRLGRGLVKANISTAKDLVQPRDKNVVDVTAKGVVTHEVTFHSSCLHLRGSKRAIGSLLVDVGDTTPSIEMHDARRLSIDVKVELSRYDLVRAELSFRHGWKEVEDLNRRVNRVIPEMLTES